MPTVSYIKPPGRGQESHRIVFAFGGRRYYFGGAKTLTKTRKLQSRLDDLIDSVTHAGTVPKRLHPWVRGLSPRRADTLVRAGLIDARHRRPIKPLGEHLGDFKPVLQTRRGSGNSHVQHTMGCLSNVVDALGWTSLDQVTEDALLTHLSSKGYRPATVRHYIQAWATFTKWLYVTGRVGCDPLEKIVKPAPTPGYDRRPLELDEGRRLLAYLATPAADEGFAPKSYYRRYGRRLVYWTALKTGFRCRELASLTRNRFNLGAKRPYIEIPGRDAKNKQMAGVPIPRELAEALGEHIRLMAPAAKVFRIPIGHGPKRWLHRDLSGAGLGKILKDDMETDFHSLRATAIVWWLEVDGFSPLRVKELARFKTLAMVQKYVRGFRSSESDYDRLDTSAPLSAPLTPDKTG
jgi:integrase